MVAVGSMEDWATEGESLWFFGRQVVYALLYVMAAVVGVVLVAWGVLYGVGKSLEGRPDE